jgi:lysophospholipase L1-like esterase
LGGTHVFWPAGPRANGRRLQAVSVDDLTLDMEEALERFRLVVRELHELNPNATVVYMGLYNPFYDIEELRGASLKMQLWNKEAYGALYAYPSMLMVPTFDLFEGRIGDYLSPDHFHPNRAGYAKIASRILDIL